MYVEIEDIEYKKLHILVLSVGKDSNIYATSAGACYRRLGKNSKPYYPNDRDGIYQIDNTDDFPLATSVFNAHVAVHIMLLLAS